MSAYGTYAKSVARGGRLREETRERSTEQVSESEIETEHLRYRGGANANDVVRKTLLQYTIRIQQFKHMWGSQQQRPIQEFVAQAKYAPKSM